MERYLSAHDASRILNVTAQAVRLMVQRGELRVAAETESRIRLFRRGDVEALATERRERKARAQSEHRPNEGQGNETLTESVTNDERRPA